MLFPSQTTEAAPPRDAVMHQNLAWKGYLNGATHNIRVVEAERGNGT